MAAAFPFASEVSMAEIVAAGRAEEYRQFMLSWFALVENADDWKAPFDRTLVFDFGWKNSLDYINRIIDAVKYFHGVVPLVEPDTYSTIRIVSPGYQC